MFIGGLTGSGERLVFLITVDQKWYSLRIETRSQCSAYKTFAKTFFILSTWYMWDHLSNEKYPGRVPKKGQMSYNDDEKPVTDPCEQETPFLFIASIFGCSCSVFALAPHSAYNLTACS
jgi:hypothetical protein